VGLGVVLCGGHLGTLMALVPPAGVIHDSERALPLLLLVLVLWLRLFNTFVKVFHVEVHFQPEVLVDMSVHWHPNALLEPSHHLLSILFEYSIHLEVNVTVAALRLPWRLWMVMLHYRVEEFLHHFDFIRIVLHAVFPKQA